jgi:predicted nucleic acid-binding Zn ribbon protein
MIPIPFLLLFLNNKIHRTRYLMAADLKNLLQTLINPQNNWKTDLLYRWHDIIGSLHSKVRIEKIHDDVLILGVSHSCWMQELYLLSPLLLKTINEKLDQPYIKQIRFKQMGSVPQRKNVRISTATKKKKDVTLTKQDERTLAQIADPALRDVLRAFRIRCYQE